MDDISKLTTDLRGLLSEDTLDEKSPHNPFSHQDTIGTTNTKKYGPPPKGTRSVSQTDDWVCKKKGPYVQLCKGPNGRRKIVRIKKGYKKKYNKAYRKWKSAG